MKKFVLKICTFFICIILIDFLFGWICSYLNSHAKGGDTKSHYYISNKSTEDIVILGSSRAIHHYIPSILSDSLNLSVYNGGVDGNGIIFLYGRLKIITDRHTPKIVIYDANTDFDIKDNDNSKYLNWLKRFYDKHGIDSLFSSISHSEKYKMQSNLYRYNTSFIQMASDNVSPKQVVEGGGYKPIYGEMDYDAPYLEPSSTTKWDPIKHHYFIKLIELCQKKNITLIITTSPMYKATTSDCFSPIKDLCIKYNIPFIDFYANNEISITKRYFKDSSHMNHDGATIFSSAVASKIKIIIDNNN